MRPLREVVVLVLAAVAIALIVSVVPVEPPPAALAAPAEWYTGAPPEMEPIVGLWYSGDLPRAHVALMLRGEAFEYGPTDAPVQKLETSAPVIWWRLP